MTNSTHKLPVSTDEYLDVAEKLAGLVDAKLAEIEALPEADRLKSLPEALPALVSLVNTVGYFSVGLFRYVNAKFDPSGEAKRNLQINENTFEKRLQALIDEVGSSSEAELSKQHLERYYVTARTKRAV